MSKLSRELLLDLEDFISEKYIDISNLQFQKARPFGKNASLDQILKEQAETFRDKLFSMIKAKGLDEVEIYKKAGMSRQVFSNIRSDPQYHPKKNTIFALAVGMNLSIDETAELLDAAGYSFTCTSKTDLIVQYFMFQKEYDIDSINEALVKYQLETL